MACGEPESSGTNGAGATDYFSVMEITTDANNVLRYYNDFPERTAQSRGSIEHRKSAARRSV